MGANHKDKNESLSIIDMLSGNHDSDIQREVCAWVSKDNSRINELKDYKEAWNVFQKPENRFNLKQSWQGVNKVIEAHRLSRMRLKNYILKFASIVILLISIGILFYNIDFRIVPKLKSYSVSTEKGDRARLKLVDGSIITLNVATKVEFQENQDSRQIKLDGEAFFDIQKSKKPLYIISGKQKIKVYGTKFNVKAYSDDLDIVTSLEKGSIGVYFEDKQKEYLMEAGQRLFYNKKNDAITLQKYNNKYQIPWVDNRLVLRKVKFRELAKKINRNFDVDVRFVDKEIENYHFTGSFNNETIEEIIETICQISKLKFSKKKRIYYLRKK
jgi:ferric-dicitrate binding protein FerR (iron transport regulator)